MATRHLLTRDKFIRWLRQRPQRWRARAGDGFRCPLALYLKAHNVRAACVHPVLGVWSRNWCGEGGQLPLWAARFGQNLDDMHNSYARSIRVSARDCLNILAVREKGAA